MFLQGHHPDMGAHAKFTNYFFDVNEFEALVKRASEHVKSHPSFKEFLSRNSDATDNNFHSEL